MWPILACSVVALAIILERAWALRRSRVLPTRLVKALRVWAKVGKIPQDGFDRLSVRSPLGRIVVAGILNRARGREIVKESIEEAGRHVVYELERFLNTLGTIAAISPMLGLLGTVYGMIDIFTVISTHGTGQGERLAGGIATALITTAAGLTVAIPSLLFYRYFRGKVDELVIAMEQEALLLADVIQNTHQNPVD